MTNPLQEFEEPLSSYSEMMRRCDCFPEIRQHLDLLERGNWRSVYKSKIDGSLWAEEFPFGEMHGGGPSAFYRIYSDDTSKWLASAPYITNEIRTQKEDQDFIDVIGEETGPETCRREGCKMLHVAYSVLCKRHHFESIRNRPYPENEKNG